MLMMRCAINVVLTIMMITSIIRMIMLALIANAVTVMVIAVT